MLVDIAFRVTWWPGVDDVVMDEGIRLIDPNGMHRDSEEWSKPER